jgi:hypothetical protein
MDYAFFENLSPEEARAYLARFLELESREVEETLAAARADGVAADFSVESVPGLLGWLGPRVGMHEVPPPPDAPDWLVDSMNAQHGGFREFDEESKPLVLRAAYYLGESFVRSHEKLAWALGRPDNAEFQQPVVTGLRTGADLPPLEVAENLMRVAERPEFPDRLRMAVDTWRAAV